MRRWRSPARNGSVKYWTHFNVFMADSEVDLFNIADTVNELPVPDVKEYCILFEHLTKWYPTSHSEKYYKVPPLAEFEAQSALHLLLEPFYENILSNTKNLDRSNLRLVKLLNYIEKNLDRELTLKQLAAIVHLNPTYLSNLFSEKFGISLIQYCNNRRIVRATDLLIHTDYSIEEIAWRQGAESTAAFSVFSNGMWAVLRSGSASSNRAGTPDRSHESRQRSPSEAVSSISSTAPAWCRSRKRVSFLPCFQ